MEGRYITAICCPLFLSNVPQRGSYKVSQLAWIFFLSILYCMQTLFWNDFYLFLKSFREIKVRYITAIRCPMFLINVPQRGSYKVSQLAWIFSLSILYCMQNISWCLCSAKALLNLLLTVECCTFDLFIPFYSIYFYLFILFSHHGFSMWLKSAKIICKFIKWSLFSQVSDMCVVDHPTGV